MIQYSEYMEQVVEPYLKERKKVYYIERETGKKIYCAKYSSEHAKGVVVFSHGFKENEVKYREVIYRFLKYHYHVYFPEHCGHGNSYRLTEDRSLVHVDSYQRYVEDLIAAAHFAKAENRSIPLYLFAHSMGGGIGLAAAAKEPHLFQKMILSSPMIRPNTGKLRWKEVCTLVRTMCRLGKGEEYIKGQSPYKGPRSLADTSSMRKEQNEYYQKQCENNPLLQTSAGSYGWAYAAIKLNHYLQRKAVRKIQTPFLLFQAEYDRRVSNQEQIRFLLRLRKYGMKKGKLVRVPNTKHEIFNASKHTRKAYFRMIFRFLK